MQSIELSLEEYNDLYEALRKAFSKDDELEVVLKLSLGSAFNEIGAGSSTHQRRVMLVIDKAISEDRIGALVTKARDQNPHNTKLNKVADHLLKRLNSEDIRELPSLQASGVFRELPSPHASQLVAPEVATHLWRRSDTGVLQVPELVSAVNESTTSDAETGTTSWADASQLEDQLGRALGSSNLAKAEEIIDQITKRLRYEKGFPERSARWLLNLLRRKRQFILMSRLAQTLIATGMDTPQIRRQYAQALIDQGALTAAEAILEHMIQGNSSGTEEVEARGLMGRVFKKSYLDYPSSPRSRANLQRAIQEYSSVYISDPQNNLWHGINVLALSARARRDKMSLALLPDEASLAKQILQTIEIKEQAANEPLPAWDLATQLEAYLALEQHSHARDSALKYINSFGTDAFEIESTLRQLTEVWQLNDQEPPGSQILPILRAALLTRKGATVEFERSQIKEGATIDQVSEVIGGLERVFAPDQLQTLKWYQKGLDRCNAIARIETLDGKARGTGWLVKASDFFSERQGVLLLTAEHIVSDNPLNPHAILGEKAQVNFQTLGQVLKVKGVFWSSWSSAAYSDLDASFLILEGEPTTEPLILHSKPLETPKQPETAPRLYIVGYPAGRDLEFSLQDNHLIAVDEKVLHYRAATQPGSSGSPVFEAEDWRVVALHHKSSDQMPRIDGRPGTYPASEGISILAIQKATRASK